MASTLHRRYSVILMRGPAQNMGRIFRMLGQGKNRKTVLKSWAIAGVMLVGVMAIDGCGSANSAVASTSQSASAQNDQRQKKNLRNPALQAVMDIRRLQVDQQMVLTSDQKDKVKPILQELINTANPNDDFLKQKAEAINAVFTDQQKSYLTSHNPKNNKNGQASNGANSKENASSDADSKNQQNGAPKNNQSRQPMQPQDIYKQVLNSLP